MVIEFTATYEKVNGWYIATAREIPGVNAQAKTLAELRQNLIKAAIDIIKTNRRLATKAHGKQLKLVAEISN